MALLPQSLCQTLRHGILAAFPRTHFAQTHLRYVEFERQKVEILLVQSRAQTESLYIRNSHSQRSRFDSEGLYSESFLFLCGNAPRQLSVRHCWASIAPVPLPHAQLI